MLSMAGKVLMGWEACLLCPKVCAGRQRQERDLQYQIRETEPAGRSQWILTKLRWDRQGIY